jgi:hypothetical protein
LYIDRVTEESIMQGKGRFARLVSWRIGIALVLWGGSLAAAGVAGALAYRHRADIRALMSDVQSADIIETNLYHLSMQRLSIPTEGRDGGIAAVDDGILFANRVGRMWFVGPDLASRELGLRVPINFGEFEADPYNVNTNRREQFAVKDLIAQRIGERVRLLASHNYWHEEDHCYDLRVSSVETSIVELQSAGEPPSPDSSQNAFWSRTQTPALARQADPAAVASNSQSPSAPARQSARAAPFCLCPAPAPIAPPDQRPRPANRTIHSRASRTSKSFPGLPHRENKQPRKLAARRIFVSAGPAASTGQRANPSFAAASGFLAGAFPALAKPAP